MAAAECTIQVPLVSFRQAVAAIVVHAEPTKTGDEVNALSRVRLVAGKSELFVVACNGTTAALASVRIVEDSRAERFAADDGSFAVDIAPGLAKDLRRNLYPMRDDADASQQIAELRITTERLTATDGPGRRP